jgi:predicted nucleotidyltransferase
MRLEKIEIDLLKKSLSSLASDAKLYLFGSRVDDDKRGGDIDLLVVSDKLSKRQLRTLRLEFFKHFGEQKIDIVLDDGSFRSVFNRIIFEKAVLL